MKITAELLKTLDSLSEDSLFPPASILEKLGIENLNAGHQIVSRTGQIQEKIIQYEKLLAFNQLRKKDPLTAKILQSFDDESPSPAHGLNVIATIFQFLAASNKIDETDIRDQILKFSTLPREIQMKHSYAIYGDNMRQAIKEYMDEREIDPSRIGITREELASLQYLIPLGFSRETAVKGANYQPRPDPVPLRPA